jgi:hypothetical protein
LIIVLVFKTLLSNTNTFFYMKFLQRIFTTVLLVAFAGMAQAQYCGTPNSGSNSGTGSGPGICTAGSNLTAQGFSPPADSMPCAVQGIFFDTVVQVKIPTTTVYSGETVTIDSVKIDTISNLPCGMCWSTEKASNTFAGGQQFCLRVQGTTYDNAGQYNLHIILTAQAHYLIFHETETVNAASVGLDYYVRVKTPTGACVAIDTTSAGLTASTYGPAPTNAVTASGSLSFCQGGSVTFTATQTSGTYQWYDGSTAIANATARTYTANAAGSYTVHVVANCQLVISGAQVVAINAPPTASVTPAGPVILCGGSTQLLTATVSGGTQQWYNGTTLLSGSTGTTYTATATGNYYVVATQNGCTDTSNKVNIQISGTPPTPTITATTLSLCSGRTDTLDAGAGYTSYAWSNGLGSGEKAYPTTAGTYTVTVMNGVCSGSGSITVTAAASTPTPTITPSGAQTICQGSSLTLTSSVATSYLWSNNAVSRSISVSTAGSFSVTTNNGCGPATSAAVAVTVTPKPNGSVTPIGPVVLCGGGSQVLTATGGTSYQWLKNDTVIAGQTNTTYTTSASGNYAAVVTQSGCIDTSNAVNIQITTTTLTPVITPTKPYLCPNATDTLNVGSGYTSYIWSGAGATTSSIDITTTGTYSVTVHNGACSGTASINIQSHAATPTPAITPRGLTTFCQGGSVILVSSSDSNNVWSNGGSTGDSITATTSGSYTVTVNDGCGAVASASVAITVNSIPVAAITPPGSTLICGGSTQVLTATPAGGSYEWIESGSAISGQTANTYSATATGTYRAVVTVNGCSDSSNTVSIQVSGTPPTPVISYTYQTLCPGQSDTLNVGAGYNSYTWSGGLGAADSIIVTTGGTYTVTVANGVCVGTASVVINQGAVTPVPAISATGSLLCGGDSITLTSSSATGNVWSNTATSQSITEYNQGIFTVTATGACGSATSAPYTVVKSQSTSVSVGPDTGACSGTSIILSASTAASSILWSNGATTTTDSVTTSGQYIATVTQMGCTASDTVNVTFDAIPTATFTQANGILTAAAVAGATYQWVNNGATIAGADSSVINVNPYGTSHYEVIVTTGYCSATSAYQLVTVTGIADVSQSISTSIYPNPTTKEITINYNLARDEDLSITITDMTGRTVSNLYSGSQGAGAYTIVTSLGALSGGIYLVSFKTPEGTLVRKVTKE